MGGFTGNGGGGGEGGPPIQPPDFVAEGQLKEIGRQKADPAGFWLKHLSALPGILLEALITAIAMMWDQLLTIIARFSLVAQSDRTGPFWELSKAIIDDLLGVETTEEINLPTRPFEWRTAHMQAIGNILFSQLEMEFASGGGLSEDQGAAAARAFLGFLITFGVREGNIALFADLLPFQILEKFRDIGVNVAHNLGLGRLARLALRPLIETVIATPLEWQLNSKYRPKVLSEALAVKANIRGHMSDDRLMLTLRRAGYTEEDIQTILTENTPSLTLAQVFNLERWGNVNHDAFLAKTKELGYPADVAELLAEDLAKARAEGEVSAYVSKLKSLYTDQFIDHDTFVLKLRETPLTEVEQRYIIDTAALSLEYPTRRMTYNQLKAAFVAGIVDLDYVQFWLQAEGYDPDSQTYLLYEILLASEREADKSSASNIRSHKSRTPSSTPPTAT